MNTIRPEYLSYYYSIKNSYGYNEAIDIITNMHMNSIRRASAVIDSHNQRIQAIVLEQQNAATSQNQDNNANSNDNNN
jgi:hypothetical protein